MTAERIRQKVWFIRPKPYSRVYSPWNGTISFSGPVRNFGLVTVIDIGDNHQIVLAGLASSDRVKGDGVLRGEPIGHLGGPIAESDEFLVEQSALPAGCHVVAILPDETER